jgi:hypothetical protein
MARRRARAPLSIRSDQLAQFVDDAVDLGEGVAGDGALGGLGCGGGFFEVVEDDDVLVVEGGGGGGVVEAADDGEAFVEIISLWWTLRTPLAAVLVYSCTSACFSGEVAAQAWTPWPRSKTPRMAVPEWTTRIMVSSMPEDWAKVNMAKSTRSAALSIDLHLRAVLRREQGLDPHPTEAQLRRFRLVPLVQVTECPRPQPGARQDGHLPASARSLHESLLSERAAWVENQ